MNIIRQPNQQVIDFLGGAQLKKENKKYRFNKFIIKVEHNNETIFYNSLTGCMVSLNEIETTNIFSKHISHYAKYMYETYFLVPENFDEDSVIEEYRNTHYVPINANYLDKIQSYTILTTTRCNARCPYCYQKPIKGKSNMSLETAEKVVDYIINSSFLNTTIKLDWFGGEPLFNKEVIDLITSRLEGLNRPFTSSMISNSYLFNDDMIEHAIKYWNLKNVQVTLDGTEEVYNKTKNYIYKDDVNPFKTIIKNMHSLLNHNIAIATRLNVDLSNIDDIFELVKFLVKEFDGYSTKGMTIYIWPIFEIGFERTKEERELLTEKMMKINEFLFEHNFGHFTDDTRGIKHMHCMVDSGSNIVITPDGSLGLCEHHIDKKLISHIDNPQDINMDEVYAWRNYIKYGEICKDCPMKPSCLKVPFCPSYNICRSSEREYTIHRATLGIIKTYNDYIESQKNKNCNCNGGQCNCGKQPICGEYQGDCREYRGGCMNCACNDNMNQ